VLRRHPLLDLAGAGIGHEHLAGTLAEGSPNGFLETCVDDTGASLAERCAALPRRRHLSLVDEESIARNASGEQLDAQHLQWLVGISLVVGGERLNEPADFREIRRDGNKAKTSKQFIFVHGESLTNLRRGQQGRSFVSDQKHLHRLMYHFMIHEQA
jgi:hypothetical protein